MNDELEQRKLLLAYDAIFLQMLDSFAVNGIKTLLLLNGGAALALLAFLGTIINGDYSKWIWGISNALFCYGIGAACIGATAGLVYISQSFYHVDDIEKGNFVRNISLGLSSFSLLFFLIASFIVFFTIKCY